MGDGTTDVVTGTIPTTKSLLTSDYVDIDPILAFIPRYATVLTHSTYGVQAVPVTTSVEQICKHNTLPHFNREGCMGNSKQR